MTKKEEWKCLFLIIVIFIAACIETDIYLPAFPDMMRAFSASEGAIQSILTWNFVGICLSGPLYGPLSDAFGRKKPLLGALGMFLLGSIITFIAPDLDFMLWGRILQGLGSGGCFTLGTAILFDAFQKEKAIQAVSNLNTIIPIIMAGAPLAGGYLNQAFGFRANFLTIALFVLVSFLISAFAFKETLPQEKRVEIQLASIKSDFKQAFTHLGFWQLTFVITLIFGAYIAFLSGTSVLFVLEFGVPKSHFPLFQVGILLAWVVAGLILNRTMAKWGALKTKKVGMSLCILGTVVLAITGFFASRNPYLLTSGMMLYAFGANWICGLYFPEVMELLPHIKGTTSSLITSMRLLGAALIVGLTSSLYNATAYPLIGVIIGTMIGILPLVILYEKKRKLDPVSE